MKQLLERITITVNDSIYLNIEGSHHQRYFAEYLPRPTKVIEGRDSVIGFYTYMVFATIGAEIPN